MKLEDQIRKLAIEGHSKTAAAGILGIPVKRFQLILYFMADLAWPKTRIPLTAETAGLIEKLCNNGNSRAETAKILGIPEPQFRGLCLRMPALKWPVRSLTRIDVDRAKAEVKGAYGYLDANLLLARDAIKAKSVRIVRGVSGSIPELLSHFKIDVSASTVRRRLANGMTAEDALFATSTRRTTKPCTQTTFCGQTTPEYCH